MGETCVPDTLEKIITLYTPPLASVLALGIKPIGLTPVTGILNPFPTYLANRVSGIETVGNLNYEPNLEKIARLKPDLILGWDHHEKDYPLLSRIGPTVLTQPNKTSSWADWQEYFKFVAEILGKQDCAQQVLDRYEQRIQDLKAALSNQYADKTISVAQISQEYGTEVYVENSFPGSILSELGLKRPTSQAVTIQPRGVIEAISNERLDLIDGDILFVLTFNEEDKPMLQSSLQDPLWQKLKAVQQGQVYLVDGWTWVVSNPLAANAVLDDLAKYLINAP
ncbi:MAG: iron-siderophore ABC transporter substrate-binding protein [Cyanobacteria bacterium J06635_15]